MTLRLFLDENIARLTVVVLRSHGHDVEWGVESTPGWTDPQVLKYAVDTDRVLVTLDSDFGDLIFYRLLPPAPAVVFLRLRDTPPREVGEIIHGVLASESREVFGWFTTITLDAIRQRRLPGATATTSS